MDSEKCLNPYIDALTTTLTNLIAFTDLRNTRAEIGKRWMHKFVLMNDIICKRFASGRDCRIAGIYIRVLIYADDLLLILSTCSDLRRMLRTVFSKPTVYNTVTFITAVFC